MDIQNCKILSNEKIAKNTYKMVLECNTKSITKPGQFINITLQDFYLRRPISVCDYDANSITIIYKILGQGTKSMASLTPDIILNCMIGLGNGFDITKSDKNPIIIGGGVGVPPLYRLAKELVKIGISPKVLLGFNIGEEVFLANEFSALGCAVLVATADGSIGHKGFVTELLDGIEYDYFFTCGPLAMFKAVCNMTISDGQISLEERMGCGFGACMGCSIMTHSGAKRICKEGPVFEKKELIW